MNRRIGFNFRKVQNQGKSLVTVIPKSIAIDLGIEAGDVLSFEVHNRIIAIKKIIKNKYLKY